MEVFLIRHTSPAVEKGICYGQSDLPVADTFAEEFARLKLHLPAHFGKVYTSPLQRCSQLALKLYSKANIIYDKRLMELNFGTWEGKKWDDLSGPELDNWMKDFVTVPAPGGENFEMLYKRTKSFYDELLGSDNKQVGIVCHAGVIRAFLAIILEMPLRNAFKIPVSYASVTKIHLNAETCYSSLEFLNRT